MRFHVRDHILHEQRNNVYPPVLSTSLIDSVSDPATILKFLTLAQPDPESVEAAPGNAFAHVMVLLAMAGSLTMMVIWWHRLKAGHDPLPAAARKPLCVPLPLMICGITLALMMATMVVLAGVIPEKQGDAAVANAEQTVAGAEETSADNEGNSASDDSGTTAEDTSTAGDNTDSAEVKAKFTVVLWQTLSINFTMFAVFGLTILLAQQTRSRRLRADREVTYERFPTAAPQPDITEVSALNTLKTASLSAAEGQTLLNPYVPANPFIEDAAETDSPALDEWHFGTELRFAFETFLVAYLPTAAVRIVILLIMPDAPSHPFLKMLDDGVDWNVVSLIALMAVVVAPLVEELLYRVTILGGMWQQRALPAAWVVSSVLFSFAHGFPDCIALLPLAFAIGYTYIRRRSYRTVVLVHFLFNAFNMAIAGVSML